MNNLMSLIRPDLREFSPYSSARDEAIEGSIWLNANESPFDFELHEGVTLNRYPEKQPIKLIQRLASIFNVENDQIAVSRGSDEMIDLLIRLFCSAGKDAILTCSPTYGMYSVYARLQGTQIVNIPLLKGNNFQIDLSSILYNKNNNIKIIFICSPNNPTGNLLKKEDILRLCKEVANKSIVVIDEAYIDYADATSLANHINEYDNLVILRTLSKAYGLAAARFGVLLANKNIIQWILKIIAPYPLPSLITKLVFDALSPQLLLQVQQEIICIKSERTRLFNALKDIPFIKKVWPSEANFFLIETDCSQKVMDACAKQGIILRSQFDKIDLNNAIRITVGLPEENNQLIQVLQQVR